jgi:DNA modification methylase
VSAALEIRESEGGAVKPYYDAHGITLYVGDARDILPTLRHGRDGFDILIADPPYGVEARPGGHRRIALALERISGDESRDAGVEIVDAAWRALCNSHRHAYVFGPFPLSVYADAGGCCELIWDKMVIGLPRGQWCQQHEYIQFAIRGTGPVDAKQSGGLIQRLRRGSVLRHMRPNGSGAKHHITEKPVSLLRELIEMSSRHGETVLDPCTGSGSTLVAALLEGRKAVGIELEVEWADVAVRRLEEATRQGALFGFGEASP